MILRNNALFCRRAGADLRRTLLLALAVFCIVFPVVAAERDGGSVTSPPDTAALLAAGRWADALDRLLMAYEESRADPRLQRTIALCYRNIGITALETGHPEEAIDAFDRGLRFARRNPDLHLGLGRAYLAVSDYRAAEAALLDALALRPDHPAAHCLLGDLSYLTDDAESALFHWERALETGGEDPVLVRRLDRLRRQQAAARHFDTVADHRFSVRFDGERNPELRDIVLEILADAAFSIGQQLNIWPNRQIGVMLLTRTAFFDITGSPGWAGGIYEGQIKVPVAGYRPDLLETILHHEYVHAVLFDFLSDRCPWWLNEGLAQYFSPDPDGNRKKRALARKLLADGDRPSLDALSRRLTGEPESVIAAYALALSATSYLIETFDLFSLQSLLEGLRDGLSPEAALQEAIGYSLADFRAEWIASVRGASR